MAKKHKQKKKIQEISIGLSKQCQITDKPSYTPSGKTVLDDHIKPELLAKWPKLKLKVPPVFIHTPVDFEQHVRKLLHLGIKFYQPHIGKNYTRVICESFNDHKYLVQYLDKRQLPYHTFGNPSKRKMKVVIKELPIDVNLNTIKEELKSVSIPIIRVHQMLTADRRNPNIVVLAVVPYDDDGKAILKVTQLMGHSVTLEPPKDKPKQCHRCQKWGHSQRYCHGQIRCVKCSGEHLTKKCDKAPDMDPLCANCGENHTASYKKCSYASGRNYYKIKKQRKIIMPCNKPVLVTMENCHTLYKNVDYNKKDSQ